jgi:hypothetical protein
MIFNSLQNQYPAKSGIDSVYFHASQLGFSFTGVGLAKSCKAQIIPLLQIQEVYSGHSKNLAGSGHHEPVR